MRFVRFFFFIALATGLLAACSESKKAEAPVTCKLAYTAKVHYAPQILALQKGWFTEPGVVVQGVDLGMSAGIAAAEALVSGSADVAVMGDVPAIFALASQRPCILVASYGGGEAMHAIVVPAAIQGNDPQTLVGKRIGVQFGSSTHGAVYLYLHRNGIDPSQVILVNISQGSLVEALLSGSIDALAASEPSPMLALEKIPGAHLFATLGGLGNNYPLMIVASKGFADAHPNALKAVIKGTRRAVDYINNKPEAAAKDVALATGAPISLEEASLKKLEWGVRLDDEVLNSLAMTARFLHDIGRLENVPDVKVLVNPSLHD